MILDFVASVSAKVWVGIVMALTVVALLFRFKNAGRLQERQEATQKILENARDARKVRETVRALPEPAVYDRLQRFSRR